MKEKRNQVLRRQVNDAFTGPDGRLSLAKTLAVFTQISALYHLNLNFTALMDRETVLLIILSFLIAPDIVKKAMAMRLGTTTGRKGE